MGNQTMQNNVGNKIGVDIEHQKGEMKSAEVVNLFPQRASISVFTSKTSPLNKKISLQNGELVKDSNGRMWKGEVNVVALNALSDLKHLIENIESNQALAIGVPYVDDGLVQYAKILSKSAYEKSGGESHTIQRSKEYFRFQEGEPAILYFDIDNYSGSAD